MPYNREGTETELAVTWWATGAGDDRDYCKLQSARILPTVRGRPGYHLPSVVFNARDGASYLVWG